MDVTPAIIVTAGKGSKPAPYYEAVWHEPQPDGGTKPAKQRIGRAWLVADGTDDDGRPAWKKRRGRVEEGYFDLARAHAAAPATIEAWRARHAKKNSATASLTVRVLAHEWFAWFRDVKGAAPSTVEDYETLLREPGAKAKRGARPSKGHLMRAFGDRSPEDVTPREVSTWLVELEAAGLGPRSINKHRQLLRNLYVYAARHDTYAMTVNPVDHTDKRREPPPARLDYFEPEEVEALCRAAAAGAHRDLRHYKGREVEITEEGEVARREADEQDGEFFRVLLYSGLRLGEARALRWRDVLFLDDMSGAMLDVRNAVSAQAEKPPKSWRPRTVPLPRQAAEALARLQSRQHFVEDDDYVFVNPIGGRLDDSALRRRYKAARDAAGLREVKLHGLRHAAGSIIATGAGVIVARDILGHARLETTNRYLHGKADVRAVATMNAVFAARTTEAHDVTASASGDI